ncbi:hypothetical protein LWI28_020015 [Acer negundo]|uniref:Ubiquitin-like domain-containing protein n=1 Tax=Acer negundo TaxID=4023 RepID=A0AAD5JC91_ACENE|nr:hypothetical protein LWI28_020015 [Acer negundo]
MDYKQEQMDHDQGTSVPDTQGNGVPGKTLIRELLKNREMIEEVRAEHDGSGVLLEVVGSSSTAPSKVPVWPSLSKTALTRPNLSKTGALVLGPALWGCDLSNSRRNPSRKLETCWSKEPYWGGQGEGRSRLGLRGSVLVLSPAVGCLGSGYPLRIRLRAWPNRSGFTVPDLKYLHCLRRMESSGTEKFPRVSEAEGSETTIEIKIKTLDSQTYTLKVDKQVPVPALKEQIASVTGVLSEQQRLICRGKVLKDDQLLSAYHVEDGHTLHMVVRQPIPPSADGSHNHPGSSHSHGASSVVIETFNVPDQGDGVPPEISQIVSAVLGSFGFSNIGSGGSGIDVRELASQRLERTSVASGTSDSTQQQAGTRVQLNRPQSAFGIPTSVSLGTLQPPVIPDSLTTLTQYLSHMRREFDGIGRGGGNNAQAASIHRTEERDSSSQSRTVQEGLPTPASLAEVMWSTRQMLIEQVGESLLQLAGELDNQVNVNDPSLRMNTQSNAWRTGVILHNLGAFLLELGRTTMTLRLGQTPSEAVVNAGPAVFISPTGPNPLMVQPLPFQPGANFSAIPVGSVQPGSGLVNGRGAGFLPRRIDIQIRRGILYILCLDYIQYTAVYIYL